MLTAITEACKGKPCTNKKMSPSLQSTTLAQGAKKKIPSKSRSNDLRLTYLQQFKQYPLPLVPLPKTPSQLCQSPWPLQLKYNPIPLLEDQVHQEEVAEAHQEEEEEVHQEEGEVATCQEEETPTNSPREMESPWACYPPYLKEIAQKLRAFSESFPPISSLTMMSQLSPPSLKESPSPSPASKDRKLIDGHSSSLNG